LFWADCSVTTRCLTERKDFGSVCNKHHLRNSLLVSKHSEFRDFAGYLNCLKCIREGRDISVGTATCYGIYGPGIESRWGTRFSAPNQTGPEAHPTSYTMGTGSFSGINRPGRGADHAPPCSAEVKERVELYLYPPLGLRGLL
jgi:hypothetical protein